MHIEREHNASGLIIEAETPEDAELLAYLWCNRVKAVAFERRADRMTTLTIATAEEVEKY